MLALSQESDVFCLGICDEKTNTDAVFAAQGVFPPNLGLIWERASSQSHVADVNCAVNFAGSNASQSWLIFHLPILSTPWHFTASASPVARCHESLMSFTRHLTRHWCSLSWCTQGVGARFDCGWNCARSWFWQTVNFEDLRHRTSISATCLTPADSRLNPRKVWPLSLC